MAQIHELNEYQGTPGSTDFLAIDNGTDTARISATDLVEPFIPEVGGGSFWYGTSSTAASTTAKAVVCEDFTLSAGVTIAVKFTNTNTASAPTLNVNETGAIAIKTRTGATASSLAGLWQAGSIVLFTYDGTNWILDNATTGSGVLVVSKSGVSSLPTNIDHEEITARHVVLNAILSNPSAQTEDWTVTTYNGYARIGPSGTINGSTDITLVLGYQTND